jgi:hypothetical protein
MSGTLRHYDYLLSSTVQGPPGPSGTSQESAGDVDDVPEMWSKIAVRDESGDAGFRRAKAAERFEVGTTDSGKAYIQSTVPTSTGEFQIDPATGRPSAYVGGSASALALERELPAFVVSLPADAAAGSTFAERPVVDGLAYDLEIDSVHWRFGDDVIGDGTNYAQLQITIRDAAGAIVAGGAVADTSDVEPHGIGFPEAFVPVEISFIGAFVVPAGGCIAIQMFKNGSGIQLPGSCLVFRGHRAE